MALTLDEIKRQIIATGKRLETCGWAPATAGNYSHRLDQSSAAITVSGKRKGDLSTNNIMRIDLDGNPLEDQKPSAETLLHTSLYKLYPHLNAVLHTHSVNSTVLSMHRSGHFIFEGYELLKAFPGTDTHDTFVTLPVFDNSQDMNVLMPQVEAHLTASPATPAYIIRGHGIYGWGRNMAEAERVIEATEFLLACEIEKLKLLNSTAGVLAA